MTQAPYADDPGTVPSTLMVERMERDLLLRHGLIAYAGPVIEQGIHDLCIKMEWACAERERILDRSPGFEATRGADMVLDPDYYFCVFDRLELILDTDGGSVEAGFHFINRLARLKNTYGVEVDIICGAMVASCGSIMLQGATGQRIAHKYSTVHYHGITMMVAGNERQIYDDQRKLSKDYQALIANLFAGRNTSPTEKYRTPAFWVRELYSQTKTGRDTYLSAQEALAEGLIDRIL